MANKCRVEGEVIDALEKLTPAIYRHQLLRLTIERAEPTYYKDDNSTIGMFRAKVLTVICATLYSDLGFEQEIIRLDESTALYYLYSYILSVLDSIVPKTEFLENHYPTKILSDICSVYNRNYRLHQNLYISAAAFSNMPDFYTEGEVDLETRDIKAIGKFIGQKKSHIIKSYIFYLYNINKLLKIYEDPTVDIISEILYSDEVTHMLASIMKLLNFTQLY